MSTFKHGYRTSLLLESRIWFRWIRAHRPPRPGTAAEAFVPGNDSHPTTVATTAITHSHQKQIFQARQCGQIDTSSISSSSSSSGSSSSGSSISVVSPPSPPSRAILISMRTLVVETHAAPHPRTLSAHPKYVPYNRSQTFVIFLARD